MQQNNHGNFYGSRETGAGSSVMMSEAYSGSIQSYPGVGQGVGVLAPPASRRTPLPVTDRTTHLPEVVLIHGIPLSLFEDYDHAVESVRQRIAAGQKTFCVAINPEKIHKALADTGLRQTLLKAHMFICDGIGAALAARLLHGVQVPRITGVNLFQRLVAEAPRQGWSVFLLGASPEANAGACRKLLAAHPGIDIAGARDGYFKDEDAIVDEINASGAQMLFVAMGSPRQEEWLVRNMHRLAPTYLMGVGGTLDVVSGSVRRAPSFFCKTGTEWLYRLVTQPQRWRRQVALPLFAFRTLRQKFLGR
jgi:N-acetylglucosaminyldiphosphoundecaprenol N-acetyl-beta-D-mannosaminyltransferase